MIFLLTLGYLPLRRLLPLSCGPGQEVHWHGSQGRSLRMWQPQTTCNAARGGMFCPHPRTREICLAGYSQMEGEIVLSVSLVYASGALRQAGRSTADSAPSTHCYESHPPLAYLAIFTNFLLKLRGSAINCEKARRYISDAAEKTVEILPS